jgi:hypothetical protein
MDCGTSMCDERLKAKSHIPCLSQTIPLPVPCREPATKLPRPCHSPKLTKTRRSPTCCLRTADTNSHIPCRSHAVPIPRLNSGLKSSLSEWHIRGTAEEQHGNSMACVNQTRRHCVKHMRKVQAKHLAERLGRGTAWERHGMCESGLRVVGSWSAVSCWQR